MTPLQTYIDQISQYPLLTKKEEIKLSHIIQTSRDKQQRQKALDKLVLGNLRLVIGCAKKIHGQQGSFDFMDIIQEGNQALLRIARLYDYREHKTSFSTYAYRSLIRRMMRAINSKARFVSIPIHHNLYAYKLLELAFKNGQNDLDQVTLSDIQNEADISSKTKKLISPVVLERIKEERNSVVLFSENFQEIIENTLADQNSPDNAESEKQDYMRKIVAEVCSPLVQPIIQEVFYKQRPIQEVALKLGISKQTLYNRLQPALIKLRMRILDDKMDFQEIPLKWIRVMEGKVKPVFRRSRRYAMKKKMEPFVEEGGVR